MTDAKEDRRQTQINIKRLLGFCPGGIKQCHNELQGLLDTYLISFNSEKKMKTNLYILIVLYSKYISVIHIPVSIHKIDITSKI